MTDSARVPANGLSRLPNGTSLEELRVRAERGEWHYGPATILELLDDNERLRETLRTALDLVGSDSGEPLIANIQARGVLASALKWTEGGDG